MKKNNWIKTLENTIPYLTWRGISKEFRNYWGNEPIHHNNITFELHILLSESCVFEIENTTITLKKGQALIIWPGVYHGCISYVEPLMRFTIAFNIQDSKFLSESLEGDVSYIIFQTTPCIQNLCYEILQEYDHPTYGFNEEMLGALFSQFWILIFRCLAPGQSSPFSLKTTYDIATIDHFFNCAASDNCTRKNLAKLIHCSERQANRILLQIYGMTFYEKKQTSRIEKAKYLLRNTDDSIINIASMVGYSDIKTFKKVFNGICKMTPEDFRKQYRD